MTPRRRYAASALWAASGDAAQSMRRTSSRHGYRTQLPQLANSVAQALAATNVWRVTGRDADGTFAFVLPQMMKNMMKMNPTFIQMLKMTLHRSPACRISEEAMTQSSVVPMATAPATSV